MKNRRKVFENTECTAFSRMDCIDNTNARSAIINGLLRPAAIRAKPQLTGRTERAPSFDHS